ncbi:MAG: TATA-box-binding protein [Candidatus Aenigmatarchaeota archaeon]|nr:TATA-box-binding protein [Candidatus Aenigmarchaeota archaeon]
MEEITIENIVVSLTFDQKLPIDKLLKKYLDIEFEPEQFPGLVYKLQDPKCSFLIFETGKIICTGNRRMEDVEKALKIISERLKSVGVDVSKAEKSVENIVASVKLEGEIDLNCLAYELEEAEFEPEQFPGLVYRKAEPKLVFLVFKSGKIICTGGKNVEEVKKELESLIKKIKNSKCFEPY